MGAAEVADIVARLDGCGLARRQPLRDFATPTAFEGRFPRRIRPGARRRPARGHEGQDLVHRLARRDLRHDGRAHDAAIGDAGDRLGRPGVLMPKPTITGRSVAP
jgi:hypothetical protein